MVAVQKVKKSCREYFFRIYYSLKRSERKYYRIYSMFRDFTMIPVEVYANNLILAERFKGIEGAVVECGVWRGGMIAGIAELFKDNREYYLFDSFQGLPDAQQIDGPAFKQWQENKRSIYYYNNCRADESEARRAMLLSVTKNFHIIKGWFKNVLPHFGKDKKIAILRLDADLYDSMLECLKDLYDNVLPGGLIIIDDYNVWDGCTKAVDDFFLQNKLPKKIQHFKDSVYYMIKENKPSS